MAKRRQKSKVRQRQIIDAARRLVVKHGSEHVTVERIAKEVGISEAAIYRHFKSKRDVLSKLVDNIADDLFIDVTKRGASDYTSLDTINDVLSNHLSDIEQRRGISFQVIAEIISLGDKKLNSKISSAIATYIDRLKNLLLEGIRSGEVAEDIDVEAAAIVLFGMIQGLVNIWALGNYSFSLQDKYSRLWVLFRASIMRH